MADEMSLDEMIDDAEENPETEDDFTEEEETEQEPDEEETSEDKEEESDEENIDESEEHSDESEEDETEKEDDEEQDSETIETSEETFKVTIAGTEMDVTKEQLMMYAQRGADNFNDKEKTDSESDIVMKQAGLTAEDLKLYAEAKGGSKEAIAQIAKLNGVDIMDVESEMADKYQQSQQYHVPTEMDGVIKDISSDPELAVNFKGTVEQIRSAGPEFIKIISENPNALKDFSGHVKSGIAQEIIPKAIHAMNTQGGTFSENYAKIGKTLSESRQTQKETVKETRTVSKREEQMRKKASAGNSGKSKHSKTSDDDIFEMSESEFEDFLGEVNYFQ